jgi:hypothetical protein
VLIYRKNKHTSGGGEGQNVDWTQDEPELPITESRLYDFVQHYTYMRWYYKREMSIILYGMNTEEQLSQPLSHPEEHVNDLHTYHIHTRMSEHLVFNQTIYFYLNS